MRFKGLDLNLLVALDALLTERNVTRAGERVHLSQSGMSAAVSRLREYFDDELLVPAGRELIPTPLAESLTAAVREVLMAIDGNIINRPHFEPETDERTYRLLVSELTLMLLVPAYVQRIAREAPNIRLEVLTEVGRSVDMLDRGEIDLFITPEQFTVPDHPTVALYKETYQCVVWTENEQVKDTLTLEQYQHASHVTAQWSDRSLAFDGWYLERYGLTRKTDIMVANLTCLPMLVVGTQRIATVHSRLALAMKESLPIRILPPPMEIPPVHQLLQWHRHRTNDPGLAWLRQLITEESARIYAQ